MKKQQNALLTQLTAVGNKIEKSVVSSQSLSNIKEDTSTPEVIVTPVVIAQPLEEVQKPLDEAPVISEPIQTETKSVSVQNKIVAQEFECFGKKREKEESPEKVVISRRHRDEIKLISTALGVPIQSLIANILDNFLETHHVEIKKAKKRLLG